MLDDGEACKLRSLHQVDPVVAPERPVELEQQTCDSAVGNGLDHLPILVRQLDDPGQHLAAHAGHDGPGPDLAAVEDHPPAIAHPRRRLHFREAADTHAGSCDFFAVCLGDRADAAPDVAKPVTEAALSGVRPLPHPCHQPGHGHPRGERPELALEQRPPQNRVSAGSEPPRPGFAYADVFEPPAAPANHSHDGAETEPQTTEERERLEPQQVQRRVERVDPSFVEHARGRPAPLQLFRSAEPVHQGPGFAVLRKDVVVVGLDFLAADHDRSAQAPDCGRRLDDLDGEPGPDEGVGRGQTGHAAADDDDIDRRPARFYRPGSLRQPRPPLLSGQVRLPFDCGWPGQYARANSTRRSDAPPHTMHSPASAGESKGMHRIVAPVSSPTCFSQAGPPHHGAMKNPPSASRPSLSARYVSTRWVFSARKSRARLNSSA